MLKKINKYTMQEHNLYNNILLLSRNKLFYTKFNLADTFQNRIHLIFIHVSFLFAKIKHDNNKNIYRDFYQKIFDLIFDKIELNMREIGHGDVTVNKNMKSLVKIFYDILLNCEKFRKKNFKEKINFFSKYLEQNLDQKNPNNKLLINYFDKYEAFCFDLSSNSVLKGDIDFNYE